MNKNRKAQIVAIMAETSILMCLAVMFLAGNDIWHDTGRADFWRLSKPPFADVRVFVCAYYVLVALVLGRVLVRLGRLFRSRQDGRMTSADQRQRE
jgi:TRAP-type C4-dicarboxylate transport system permease small subunit